MNYSDCALDAVLVFVDVSNECKYYADDEGKVILENQWNNASRMYNEQMKKKDMAGANASLFQADGSFKDVKPHIISNKALAEYFGIVYTEFRELLIKGVLEDINNYMKGAYLKFRQVLNCTNSTN